jgi:hypothetical protein
MIGTSHRTVNCDDTAANSNTLTADLQMHTNNQGSKLVGPGVFPLSEHSLCMHRKSLLHVFLGTVTRVAHICSFLSWTVDMLLKTDECCSKMTCADWQIHVAVINLEVLK